LRIILEPICIYRFGIVFGRGIWNGIDEHAGENLALGVSGVLDAGNRNRYKYVVHLSQDQVVIIIWIYR